MMMSKLVGSLKNWNREKLFRKLSPELHNFLLNRGWIAEKKWVEISGDKFKTYLADDHPDRDWFVNWVLMKQPHSILEIGAGAMHEVRKLKSLGMLDSVKYTVVDVAKEFLTRGREEFPEVDFAYGSINKLRFPDNSFDVVYCRHVLEHQRYYKRPLSEMVRVARDLVIVNLFRWSLHHDVIRRGKYYSNAYEIGDFLSYIKKVGAECEHFLVLRRETLGANQYEDENIRRTGDHLVIVVAKHPEVPLNNIYETLDRLGIKYIFHPYDGKTAI